MEKDGNCQFHAVLDQLRFKELVDDDDFNAEDLRNATINEMRDNQILKAHIAQFLLPPDTVDSYIDRMRNDREWGDNITLVVMSKLYEIEIVLITGGPDPVRFNQTQAINRTIHLVYSRLHYDSTRPI